MQTYLKLHEAAVMLGISPRSLRALVRAGRVAVHLLGPNGGVARFTELDLQEYLDSTRQYGSSLGSPRQATSSRPAKRSAATKSSRPCGPRAGTPAPSPPLVVKPGWRTTPGNNEA